mgnify:CR=1 FL=1
MAEQTNIYLQDIFPQNVLLTVEYQFDYIFEHNWQNNLKGKCETF